MLALPGAVLIGFGFAGVGLAATTFMRSFVDFDYVNMAMIPLFLFSATFFPLVAVSRPACRRSSGCTPLYQGVVLERSLVIGDLHWTLLVHVAYLVVMGWIGLRIASRRHRPAAAALTRLSRRATSVPILLSVAEDDRSGPWSPATEARAATIVGQLERMRPDAFAHARRVAHLAVRVARHAHLPDPLASQIYSGRARARRRRAQRRPELLQKDTSIDERERIAICEHTIVGARWLAGVPGLAPLVPFARWHHERFDGLGYPDGATAGRFRSPSRSSECATRRTR